MTAEDLQLRLVAEGISHFAWLARPDRTTTVVNQAVRNYVGESCLAGARWDSWVHPDDDALARQAWDQAVASETTFQVDCRLRRADGQFRWHGVTAQPVRNSGGDIVTWLGIAVDTHDTRSLQAELKKAQLSTTEALALLSTLQANAPIGLGFVDREFRQVFVNETLLAYAGLTGGDQIGRLVADMLPTLWPTLEPLYRHVLDTGESIVEVEVSSTAEDDPSRVRHWSNSYYPVVVHGQVTGVGVIALDVTERKQMQEDLSHQALHDSLTGLANRALLGDRLQQSLAGMRQRGTQLGVIFLDLDDFKLVNDSLGHSAGDELLGLVAARLTGVIRHSDTIARFGGDEFVIVCDDTSIEQTKLAAERILDAVREPYVIANREMNVTGSIGIAIADAESTPESLIRDSDSAMYMAKSRGRDRVGLFDEVVRGKNQARLDTLGLLHQALERGELSVHYQPVIDVATGAMVSAEALLRWNHASRGPITPAEFIPLAEESGLIVPFGTWVLEQAVAELVEWQRTAPEMSVAVNLSVQQMLAPDIVDRIASVVESTGISAESLCLELTESIFMGDVDYFRKTLLGFKDLGVQLSLDDFGTGYSSLNYLSRFPFDMVKIDRAFVHGLGGSPEDTALVAAILSMARALKLSVTAEGIEDEQQLAALRQLKCDRVQGFYLARPMPAAAMRTLVAESRHWEVDLALSRATSTRGQHSAAAASACTTTARPSDLPWEHAHVAPGRCG